VKQKVDDCESEIVDWIHRNNEDVNNHRSVFKFLNSFLPQHQKWHFDSVLRASDEPNESNNFEKRKDGLVGLYYYAELDENNVICLQHPQPAVSRRIFRKFGSHRFLHVMVSSKLLDQNVVNKFSEKVMLCGRKYAYLWSKAQKTPQCFVLFAESGFGIEDEISVDYVRDWCIPKKLNPELTIAKELKRMKISFSKTRPSAVLPENTIEIIPDILSNLGKPMTDGAGLISRCAINEVWKVYSGKDEWCPFSSFQGRIGGFKGMWILDELLSGFSLKCRDSQLKFMVPMRSLVKLPHLDLSRFDPNYDTVEISSWDEIPEKGHLVSSD
jgi:RNA dependent RNA polymerase